MFSRSPNLVETRFQTLINFHFSFPHPPRPEPREIDPRLHYQFNKGNIEDVLFDPYIMGGEFERKIPNNEPFPSTDIGKLGMENIYIK